MMEESYGDDWEDEAEVATPGPATTELQAEMKTRDDRRDASESKASGNRSGRSKNSKSMTNVGDENLDGGRLGSLQIQSMQQEEMIQKLKVANAALRHQLKEFSRALDATLRQKTNAGGGGRNADGISDRERAAEDEKRFAEAFRIREQQYKNLEKKVGIYRRANKELQHKLAMADKGYVTKLENMGIAKDKQIEELLREKKNLEAMQRQQSKAIEQQENSRSDYPRQIQRLQEEIRVYRDRLRKKQADMVQSARVSQQQFQQLCQTRDEAKALKAEVARFRKATKRGEDIPTVAEERIAKHKKDSEESAKKMVKEIEVLKRAREQDRKKYGRELRQNKEAIRKAKEEIEMGKEIIKAKEREIREHAVAAKKLKRQLRDLIGGTVEYPSASRKAEMIYGSANPESNVEMSFRMQGPKSSRQQQQKPQPPPGQGRLGKHAHPNRKPKPLADQQKKGKRNQGNKAKRERARLIAESEEDLEREAAALSVQSAYRGMAGRRKAKRRKKNREAKKAQEFQAYMEDNAAVKLQSNFRGHQARKAVKKKREEVEGGEDASVLIRRHQSTDYDNDDFEEDFEDDTAGFASSGDDGGGYVPSAASKNNSSGFSKPGFAAKNKKKKKKDKFSF